jgi:tape measure domain-containing protein
MEEMKGAVIQLAQGMASGRLQGEELRSVLENPPLVAMEIANALDIDIGKIREFAAEGKISTAVIVRALQDVEVAVEDLPETFSMAMSRIKTEWDLLLAHIGQGMNLDPFWEQVENRIRLQRIAWGDLSTLSDERLSFLRQTTLPGPGLDKILAEIQKRADAEVEINKANEARLAMLTLEEKVTRSLTELRANFAELDADLDISGIMRTVSRMDGAYDEIVARAHAARRIQLEHERAELQAEFRRLWAEFESDPGARVADSLIEGLKSDQQKFFELIASFDELVAKGDLSAQQAVEIARQKYQEIMDIAREATEEEKRLLDEIDEELEDNSQEVEAAWKQLGLTFKSAFEDAIVEGEKLSDVLKALYKDMLRIWVRFAITQPFTESMKKLFGRASGGPVSAGTGYVVGEEGPEYFTPNRSGFIIPNHKLGMAGGAMVTYNIDARGADDSIFARMIPLLERTKQATEDSIRHQMREGRFT